MSPEGVSHSPHILVAPLDWGLGHATRCIPLIKELLSKGCRVSLAGEGKIRSLLIAEFPGLPFLELKGYRIQYPGKSWQMPFKIAAQIPQILSAIKQEHEWLQKAARDHKIDGIISDNRYGLHHSRLPSVFISHQLVIQTGMGEGINTMLQQLNYRYINQFSTCWVPDFAAAPGLAGALSHPQTLPATTLEYTGPLSRFDHQPGENKHLLVLLSGPEPQRTLLEKQLAGDLKKPGLPVVVVRGLPGDPSPHPFPAHVQVYQHLPGKELERLMAEASFIIARCGYSTIMDICRMQKKAVLVPTPGQTEQEYLMRHLMEQQLAFCVEQKKFRLQQALDLASQYNYKPFPAETKKNMESAINRFLMKVNHTRGVQQ